jgi:hypothetical protein
LYYDILNLIDKYSSIRLRCFMHVKIQSFARAISIETGSLVISKSKTIIEEAIFHETMEH